MPSSAESATYSTLSTNLRQTDPVLLLLRLCQLAQAQAPGLM